MDTVIHDSLNGILPCHETEEDAKDSWYSAGFEFSSDVISKAC